MNQPTAARPQTDNFSHWYSLDGNPCHTVPRADNKGTRPATLADARKRNLLPSVTNILRLLDKPGLNRWKEEQVALAILTAPRKQDEKDDEFVKRVLQEEKQHEQEAKKAGELGTKIHDALESYFSGEEPAKEFEVYVRPVIDQLLAYSPKASPEVILVGDDYAGLTDLIQDCSDYWGINDFKCTKSMPDPKQGPWLEHRLQLAAYAKALDMRLKRAGQSKIIIPRSVYISTERPGEFLIIEHEGWEECYEQGFAPLVRLWQYVNRYRPENPKRAAVVSVAQELEATRAENKRLSQLVESASAEMGKLKTELEQLRARPIPEVAPTATQEDEQILDEIEAKPTPTAEAAPAPAATPAKGLPETIGGRKVVWSTGVQLPSPPQAGT